ncbi:unnamed protein product [Nesidiocoris tenuis]|uniref:Cationic amino acid transporter C-terminal domain-containing protein n=1 Tax=Nesidiocoris tenuis TaxID=355587 RepID=A0A6H5GMQ4_9HEMI|nr:unnamed protein product [Nesidiocoris tenuis]
MSQNIDFEISVPKKSTHQDLSILVPSFKTSNHILLAQIARGGGFYALIHGTDRFFRFTQGVVICVREEKNWSHCHRTVRTGPIHQNFPFSENQPYLTEFRLTEPATLGRKRGNKLLGTMNTSSGAEYAYFMDAFGPLPAFLFSWVSTLVLKPSQMAIICLSLAKYSVEAFYSIDCDPPPIVVKMVAVLAIILGVTAWLIPVSVTISTFGSAHGTLFAAGRLCFAASREGHLLNILSYVHVRRLTPAPGLIFHSLIAVAMVASGTIDSLIDFFSFTAWIFYGGAMLALIVMRYTRPNFPRPYKVPIIIPVLVLVISLYLIVAPIVDTPQIEYLYATFFILGGLIFYVPFVHYGYTSPWMEKFTVFCQLLFEVAPTQTLIG